MRTGRRIHITGGPGSGKTFVAKRIGPALGLPVYHLDEMALDLEAVMPSQETFQKLPLMLPDIVEQERWLTEGAYLGWASPLLDRADLVIWTDTPGRVALYRIVVRHLKAELARNNRFPGWRRFLRFWRWCAGYYTERNTQVLGRFGVPETREHLRALLRSYEDKLVVCRGKADIEKMLAELSAQDRVV